MKKLDKNTLEFAVIFKKRMNSKKFMTFSPIDVVLGHLDEETNEFVTRTQEQYKYIIGRNTNIVSEK